MQWPEYVEHDYIANLGMFDQGLSNGDCALFLRKNCTRYAGLISGRSAEIGRPNKTLGYRLRAYHFRSALHVVRFTLQTMVMTALDFRDQ
ncbi:MAG: hypothetical protein WB689_36395 [Xanthobacteraceae bacterium]